MQLKELTMVTDHWSAKNVRYDEVLKKYIGQFGYADAI